MKLNDIISLYEPSEQKPDDGFSDMEMQRILNKTTAKLNQKPTRKFRKTRVLVVAAVLICAMSITALAVGVYRSAIWEKLLGSTVTLDGYINTDVTLMADSKHYRYTVNETLFTSDSACIMITMEPIDEYGRENIMTEEIEVGLGFSDADGNSPKSGLTIDQTEEESAEGTRRIMLRQTYHDGNALRNGMTMTLGIVRYDETYEENLATLGILGEVTLITSSINNVATNGFSITIQLDSKVYVDMDHRYDKVDITSLGINFTGSFEDGNEFQFPHADFTLVFADGTEINSTTELENSANANDPNYKHFAKGGSGDGDPRTGELVWGLSFTQAMDISTLTGVWVDGMYYAIDYE